MHKCLNGQLDHDIILLSHEDQHTHNIRYKDSLRLPSAKRQWGQQRTTYQAVDDFNSLSQDIQQSANIANFKRNILKLN